MVNIVGMGEYPLYVIHNALLLSTFTIPQYITVIHSAYNEEISIGTIVLLTRQYADKVIVVDGGSVDRTADVARKAGAEVITHRANTGKGGALKTGFTDAVSMGTDIIVTMDSNGQNNPAEIPKLVDPIIKREAEMVNGSRYLNGFMEQFSCKRSLWEEVCSLVQPCLRFC